MYLLCFRDYSDPRSETQTNQSQSRSQTQTNQSQSRSQTQTNPVRMTFSIVHIILQAIHMLDERSGNETSSYCGQWWMLTDNGQVQTTNMDTLS